MTQKNKTTTQQAENIATIKRQLELHRGCLVGSVHGLSYDFTQDHSASDSNYIDDAITEYADGATSIYYSDQRRFYNDNEDVCLEALEMFGYTGESLADLLKECGDLDGLICKAGAIGEYYQNESQLQEDKNDIIKIIFISYILDNWDDLQKIQLNGLEFGDILRIIDDLEFEQIGRFNDLIDYLQEKTCGASGND